MTAPCIFPLNKPQSKGYVQVRVGGRKFYAHRLAYEAFYGPIPEGLHIDHLCNVRACCNPEHLEAVTSGENNRRTRERDFTNVNANKTECIHGHPFDEENTYARPSGGRACRTCLREIKRAFSARKKAALE